MKHVESLTPTAEKDFYAEVSLVTVRGEDASLTVSHAFSSRRAPEKLGVMT